MELTREPSFERITSETFARATSVLRLVPF